MKIETYNPIPTFFGLTARDLGLHHMDRQRLVLNKQEQATIRRAIAIREEARERIREAMGTDDDGTEWFCYSPLYALAIDDLVGGLNDDDVFLSWQA